MAETDTHLVYEHLGAELRLIENPHVRAVVLEILSRAPEHFYTQPSSSTGKYHPADEFSEGGNILHTRRVVKLADELCHAYGRSGIERDKILGAAMIHDSAQYGWGAEAERYSQMGHEGAVRVHTYEDLHHWDFYDDVSLLARAHAGRWGPSVVWDSVTQLGLPELAALLHIADYIASRRYVTIDVNE